MNEAERDPFDGLCDRCRPIVQGILNQCGLKLNRIEALQSYVDQLLRLASEFNRKVGEVQLPEVEQ